MSQLASRTFEEVSTLLQAMGKIGPGHTHYLNNSTVLSRIGGAGSSDRNSGEDLLAPLATFEGALRKLVAGRGDNILIGAGHAEAISAASSASGFDLDKDGVTARSMGRGDARATFTFDTAATADANVSAADCVLDGLRFLSAIDEQGKLLDVTGANCKVLGCEFRMTDATDGASNQAIAAIQATAAANRLEVRDCLVWGLGTAAAAGTTNAFLIAAADDVVIEDNFVELACTSGEGAINNTAAGARWRVRGNTFNNTLTGNTKAMIFHASTTGLNEGNQLGILSGTAPWTAAGMNMGRNWYQNAVGTLYTVI